MNVRDGDCWRPIVRKSITGLTTIRDYDDYTFVHSVNVTIFSVALGKRLGLTKLQLYDLGLAALFHDVGKSRVPLDVLNKAGGLNEEEWRIMQSHPWLGVLVLFGLRGYGEIPYRPMIAAYEHHMKIDLTGYPASIRPRQMSMFSKIVAVADAFDAATSRRVYETTPLQPADVLKEMWENPRRGQDVILAACAVALGHVEEARQAVRKVLALKPGFSLAAFAKSQPYKDPKHLDRLLDHLRTAGLE